MFVFLVLLQSGTGKIPENISKLARRQFSRDRSFTKDLAAKLRVWLKFASGKKSEADFEISHGSGALGASAAVVRWRMFCPSRPQRSGLILTMGTWDRCFMMAFYRLMLWDLNVGRSFESCQSDS